MFLAVLRDAGRDPRLLVTAILDEHGPVSSTELPTEVAVIRTNGQRHDECLAESARGHDWMFLVAPETDGELSRLASLARDAGGRLPLPSAGFIDLASNKHASLLAVAAAGLPVPAGRLLAPGECLPPGFRLPAARKQNGSAGCDGLVRVEMADGASHAASTWERAEYWQPGRPVGVAVLCGPECVCTLPPCEQKFEGCREPVYIGGRLLADAGPIARAKSLALRAVTALAKRSAPASGWVGVDMILGERSDGKDDRVLEVNPRLTTSFIGLSAGAGGGIVRTILDITAGLKRRPDHVFNPFVFTTTGEVSCDAR